MSDFDVLIGVILGLILGFLISVGLLLNDFYIYEDINGNYGKSDNCFEKYDKSFCELGDESIIEVKTFEKE